MIHDEHQRIVPPAPRRAGPDGADAAPPQAKGGGKNKKIANSLVALGSAAIISVYGLGYVRTQSAEASLVTNNPTIAIATAAPTTSAAASSQIATFPSPLFGQSSAATAAPSATATSIQSSAATVGVASTATAAPAATTAPATVAKAPATATTAAATKVPATATTSAVKTAAYTDGTYTGTGTSRHGSITASVVIQGGKIVSAGITQCGTRYPCSQIAALPGEVVAAQSATIDFVSGATDSSQAYRGAIQNALAKAAA